MASIFERFNRDGELIGYQAQVRKRGYPTQTKTFPKKRDALAWVTVTESAMIRGVHQDRRDIEGTTLNEAITDYLAKESVKHGSHESEKYVLNKFLRDEPKLVQHGLTNLKKRHFEDWRDRRLKQVKASSVKREISILTSVIKYATRSCPLPINPLAGVCPKNADVSRDVVLRDGEAGALIDTMKKTRNPWVMPVYLLGLETAMRRGEILKAKWDHIDWENRTLKLPKEVTKTETERLVPLSSLAIAILKTIADDGDHPLGLFDRPADERIFGTTVGAVKQAFEHARDRAKMSHFHFHDLRHTAATETVKKGWHIAETAVLTGHKDMRSLKRYLNLKASDVAKKMG